MLTIRQPFFKKSKKGFRDSWGLLKNRFEYFGIIGSDGYLSSDPGEMNLYEGISFSGRIQKDIFEGQSELKHVDGISMIGSWSKGKLVKGKIIFKEITHIKAIEIDSKENNYQILLHNDHTMTIKSGLKYKFNEKEHSYTLSFKFVRNELLVRLKTRKSNPLMAKKVYKEVHEFNPSIRLTKYVVIENSIITMDIFSNYKVCYCIEETGNEIVLKLRFVFYTNGTVFCGKSSYRKNEDEPAHISGELVDLDDYLMSNNPKTEIPHFEKFIYNLGKAGDPPTYFINRFQVEDILVLVLATLMDKKNIFDVIIKFVMSNNELTFDWNQWNPDGYFQMVINPKAKFVYKNRISKGMNSNFIKQELEGFNWNTFSSQDYFQQVVDIKQLKTFY
jgi:hypothetical protein